MRLQARRLGLALSGVGLMFSMPVCFREAARESLLPIESRNGHFDKIRKARLCTVTVSFRRP